jgi:hypothetical protein
MHMETNVCIPSVMPGDDPPPKWKRRPGKGGAPEVISAGTENVSMNSLYVIAKTRPNKPTRCRSCLLRRRYHLSPIMAKMVADMMFGEVRP